MEQIKPAKFTEETINTGKYYMTDENGHVRPKSIKEQLIEMEKDKYYTPELSEFYLGFECEFKNNMVIPIEFRKEICEQETLSIAFDTFEHENEKFKDEFRVKYLDKEDILSLGWVYHEKYCAFHHSKHEGYSLYFLHEDTNEMKIIYYGDCNFNGIIKNKSELKKLMKQMSII